MKFKTPYADLVPPLSTDEFATLKADIKAHGLLNSVIVTEDGELLDGHNRYKITPKEAEESPTIVYDLTPAERQAFVIRSNMNRRNLSPAQKVELRKTAKAIAVALREEDHKRWTQEAIANEIGYDRSTVAKWFSTSVNDHDGTKRDSRVKVDPREKPKIAERVAKGESQAQVASDYGVSQKAVSNVVREETKQSEVKQQRAKAAKKRNGNNGVIHGDFRKGAIEPDSYDLIFTDPPYDKEAVSLYEDLAEYASKTLCKGGWLITYSGQQFLPEVYAAISQHLTYAWTFACLHSGGDLRFRKLKLQNGWKPIIAAYRPPLSVDWEWFKDVVSGGKEKADHDWQQAESEAAYFIERLCPPKGIVCDPFSGSGTTLCAAKSLKRRWIGFEIDQGHADTARAKLDD